MFNSCFAQSPYFLYSRNITIYNKISEAQRNKGLVPSSEKNWECVYMNKYLFYIFFLGVASDSLTIKKRSK